MRPVHAITALVAACGTAFAASAQTVTLFGQEYEVQRFDYASEFTLPNVAFPNDPPIAFTESEGVQWIGYNRLLMSADDISDFAFGNPDNWVIEVQLDTDMSGAITGLSYVRAVVIVDIGPAGYDPNPTGITVNAGTSGLGAGGNIILSGDGALYGYNFTTGSLLEFPTGSGCLATPGACNLNLAANTPSPEDVLYVPASGGNPDSFYIPDQDFSQIDRWSTTGTYLGSFPVGTGITPSGVAEMKGLGFFPAGPTLPSGLANSTGGAVIASFDDNFPVLQAFDLNGGLLGTEILTTDGTPGGPSRLDLSGCVIPLQVESVTVDPATGRIFLNNQGAGTTCAYLFVLTPVPACPVDLSGNGLIDADDIFAFLNTWFGAGPGSACVTPPTGCPGDWNNDGIITADDIFAFLNDWFAAGPGSAC